MVNITISFRGVLWFHLIRISKNIKCMSHTKAKCPYSWDDISIFRNVLIIWFSYNWIVVMTKNLYYGYLKKEIKLDQRYDDRIFLICNSYIQNWVYTICKFKIGSNCRLWFRENYRWQRCIGNEAYFLSTWNLLLGYRRWFEAIIIREEIRPRFSCSIQCSIYC